jgi:hypothetical protein
VIDNKATRSLLIRKRTQDPESIKHTMEARLSADSPKANESMSGTIDESSVGNLPLETAVKSNGPLGPTNGKYLWKRSDRTGHESRQKFVSFTNSKDRYMDSVPPSANRS